MFLTDASGMDWSTLYANALAQMLNDKNLSGGGGGSGGNSSSHTDVITLPQNRSTVVTSSIQQPPISSDVVAELKQPSDSQLKSLLAQTSPSQQARLHSADVLATALRSHSPNHSLAVSAGTSPKLQTAISQDLHANTSHIPIPNHDLQAANNLAGLNVDKTNTGEDNKQRLSPYHTAIMTSDQQLSPNTAALAMANLSNQKSPTRQQTVDVKEEVVSLATNAVGTTALPSKDDLVLTDDTTKLLLKQLAQQQQQLPHQPQKSMPGSIVIPSGGSDQQEELTIHPGGSGELMLMSYYITCMFKLTTMFLV